MNIDMDLPVTYDADRHPDENELLLALEQELPDDHAAQVEKHLGNCWSCRARSEQIERGILGFVEYRERRYLPALPDPPQEFRKFPRLLQGVVAGAESAGLLKRTCQHFLNSITFFARIRWVSLVAAATAAVFFWVEVFIPPSLTAAELLSRATAAQNPLTTQKGNEVATRRTVHQKVRIRSAGQTVIRNFEWPAGGSTASSVWNPLADATSWNSPLTATGFAAWHDHVGQRTDEMKRWGDRLTLITKPQNNPIIEASLVVRYSDFHPLAQEIRFAGGRQLDIEELAFEISEDKAPAPQFRPGTPSKPAKAPKVASAVDLNDLELNIRYIMFSQQWDLGEDLNVSRHLDRILVNGTASSPERAAAIQSTLGKLSGAHIVVANPAKGPSATASAKPSPKSSSEVSMPLLREALETRFASREERLDFVDSCLTASDAAMSHAWALRKLAERYTPPEERRLSSASRAKLHEMLRAHIEKLSDANGALNPLLDLLPDSPIDKMDASPNWISAVLALFKVVQEQDSLVAALVAGTQAGAESQTPSARFRFTHNAIGILLHEITGLADSSDRQ